MENPNRIQKNSCNRVALLPTAVVATLTATMTGGAAMGDVIVVRPSSQIIISNNVEVGVFRDVPEPITRSFDPSGTPFPDSIRFSFTNTDDGPVASIHSNSLPNGSWGFPPDSPSLSPTGALNAYHATVDSAFDWRRAEISIDGDSFIPARLLQSGIFGDFRLQDFDPGESAYVPFSDYALTMFGYVQIRRVGSDIAVWELVGYAYDDSGAGVYVEDLYVPTPPSMAILSAGVIAGRFRRRER